MSRYKALRDDVAKLVARSGAVKRTAVQAVLTQHPPLPDELDPSDEYDDALYDAEFYS